MHNGFFNFNFKGKSNAYIVNFNYTSSCDLYIDEISEKTPTGHKKIDINYIHGKLCENIIFGYGDDKSDEYKKLKNSGVDEYIENFKTFHYFENYRYREIIDKINDYKDYEVYILGHSLGKTDKTLLNEILSPEKCLNIHFFKRPHITLEQALNQLRKLHFNLARILDDDNDMRKKVIPIKLSPHFPFINEDLELLKLKKERLKGGSVTIGKSRVI